MKKITLSEYDALGEDVKRTTACLPLIKQLQSIRNCDGFILSKEEWTVKTPPHHMLRAFVSGHSDPKVNALKFDCKRIDGGWAFLKRA